MNLLHKCTRELNGDRNEVDVEFDELREIDGTTFGGMPMFSIGMTLPDGTKPWAAIIMSDPVTQESYILYNGKKYQGTEGLNKLTVVLEREKIAKMLDSL